MTQHLPSLEFVFLVGIGAGVPSRRKDRDIRLGDVAVAIPGDDNSGIIHYDHQKILDGSETKLKGFSNSTDRVLRNTVGTIRTVEGFAEHSFLDHLNKLQDNRKAKSFLRPQTLQPYPGYGHPAERDSENDPNDPKVHYGTFLSGNSVVRSKEKTDELAEKYNAICIEMEAGGLVNSWPAVVIRGISDFGDSSKNDDWHAYALLTVAAYAKEVLRRTEMTLKLMMLIYRGCINHCPSVYILARKHDIDDIEEHLGEKREHQKVVMAVFGLAGIGKTQLANQYARTQLLLYPKRKVFWIQGESQETFEQSITKIFPPNEKGEEKRGDGNEHVKLQENHFPDGWWASSRLKTCHQNINNDGLKSFIKSWRTGTQRDLNDDDRSPSHRMKTIFEDLQSLNPVAAETLCLFGFLDPTDMCHSVMEFYRIETRKRIASLYRVEGRHEEAINIYLSIVESPSSHRPDIVEALNNLGLSYYRKGNDDQAIESYRQIFKTTNGLKVGDIPTETLYNIAQSFLRLRKKPEAEASYTRYLQMFDDVTEKVWRNWQKSDNDTKCIIETEKELSSALKEQEALLSPTPSILLAAQYKLAVIYLEMSRYSPALGILKDLELKYRERGDNDDNTRAVVMLELARGYMESGLSKRENDKVERNIAEEQLRESYIWNKKVLELDETPGSKKPTRQVLQSAQLNLGFLDSEMGNLEDAEKRFKKDLDEREKILGFEHPKTLAAVFELALVSQKRKQFRTAKVRIEKATKICEGGTKYDYTKLLPRALFLKGELYQQWIKHPEEYRPAVKELESEARRAYERVLSVCSKDVEFHWKTEKQL
ncbi:hypothetical protein E0Z10_g6242 [Xylaria hypoxylon]|uniref:Nucleoside phosphorylase domain-containing protein n=1 Tax=Xylaria hypoxylon TaxID=37992 RepID=A0A4Z0YSZ4_9PEZI|nr:hypothetical protein E0Z10_g6242 [Xylaria hypoxylon]